MCGRPCLGYALWGRHRSAVVGQFASEALTPFESLPSVGECAHLNGLAVAAALLIVSVLSVSKPWGRLRRRSPERL